MMTTLEPGCDSVMSLSRLTSYPVKWTDTLICMSVLHSTHWQKSIFSGGCAALLCVCAWPFWQDLCNRRHIAEKGNKGRDESRTRNLPCVFSKINTCHFSLNISCARLCLFLFNKILKTLSHLYALANGFGEYC